MSCLLLSDDAIACAVACPSFSATIQNGATTEAARMRRTGLLRHGRHIIGLMPVSLKDQVVLVVGASRGIGRATAIMMARDGAKVMASARGQDRLDDLQRTSERILFTSR